MTVIEQLTKQAQDRLAELEPEVTTLHRTVAALTGREIRVTISTRLDEVTAERDALKAEVERLKTPLDVEDPRIAELQSELEQAKADRGEQGNRIAHLEAELEQTKRQAHALKEERDQARADLHGSEDRMLEWQERAVAAEARVEELESRIRDAALAASSPTPDTPEAPASPTPDAEPPADAPTDELESGGKGEGTPEQESESAPPVEEPEAKAKTDRRGTVRNGEGVTMEQVRDAAREHFGYDTPFKLSDLREKMGNQSSRVTQYVRKLTEAGTFERSGGIAGPSVRYTFPRPNGNGPTHRPRGEEQVVASAAPQRGEAVPGTGKPVGPAEKPGKLKRQQQKAAAGGSPVKRKRVGGVRV